MSLSHHTAFSNVKTCCSLGRLIPLCSASWNTKSFTSQQERANHMLAVSTNINTLQTYLLLKTAQDQDQVYKPYQILSCGGLISIYGFSIILLAYYKILFLLPSVLPSFPDSVSSFSSSFLLPHQLPPPPTSLLPILCPFSPLPLPLSLPFPTSPSHPHLDPHLPSLPTPFPLSVPPPYLSSVPPLPLLLPSCRLALAPLAIACISASTLIGLGMIFTIGAINFVLAIGAKWVY